MKTNMLKLLCAVICLLTVMVCHGALAEDGWEYRASEDGFAEITSYIDEGNRIVSVPDKIDGKWVVSIGEDAFKNADRMKIVAIPGTVTHIHENAFSGRTDFCIRAYNGSAALKFASVMGVESQNLSDLYFTEGVVDLTGIDSSEYSYITNGVRLLNAHARRLEVGSLFFIPGDERNKLGEAYEVRAMEEDGKYVNIKMAKADPTLVLTKVKFELTDLVPDYENAEILSDCVTEIKVYNDKNLSYNNPYPLNQTLSSKFTINGWTLDTSVAIDISELSFDVDLMPFVVHSFNIMWEMENNILIEYESNESFKTSIDFLKVPFVSAYGAVTVYGVLSLDIELTGKVSLELKFEDVHQMRYTPQTGLISLKDKSKPSITATMATELKGRISVPKFTVEVPVVGELIASGYYVEASLKGKTAMDILNPQTIICSDATFTLSGYFELWIGIKIDDRNEYGITKTTAKGEIAKEFFHLENFKPVERCTKEGSWLHFDTGCDWEIPPLYCPGGVIPAGFGSLGLLGYAGSEEGVYVYPYKDSYGDRIHGLYSESVNARYLNYEFDGWFYEPQGSVDATSVLGGDKLTEKHVTIYAHWREIDSVELRTASKEAWEDLYDDNIISDGFYGTNISSITIPEGITQIVLKAFAYCDNLRSVSFPNNPIIIDPKAFYGCDSLTEITVHAKTIDRLAFADCSNLKKVNIIVDDGCYIAPNAFLNTPALEEVNIIGGNDIHIEYGVFNYSGIKYLNIETDGNVVLKDVGGYETEELNIKANEVNVYRYEIYGSFNDVNSYVRKVNIDANALVCDFPYNEQLEEVNINAASVSLGDYGFNGCTALEKVNISGSVAFGTGGFYQTDIREISFEVDNCALTDGMFANCANLEKVELTGTITSVTGGAFKNCVNLKEVILPQAMNTEGDAEIQAGAFDDCTALERVVIGEGMEVIRNSAFKVCASLREVELPESLTSIEWRAFEGCTSLREVELPENLTTIEWGVFRGCSNLEDVDLPNGITLIDGAAFEGCTALNIRYLPQSLETIGASAFAGCESLVSLTFPDSIKTISAGAFKDCVNLATLYMPSGNVDIFCGFCLTPDMEYAFSGCESLERIYCALGCPVDKLGEEYGIASGPMGQVFYDLTVETNSDRGTLSMKAKPGQNCYPDRLMWGTGYGGSGFYTDRTCTEWAGYPYVMPEADATIYMHCGGYVEATDDNTKGGVTSGDTLTDCSATGEYYVIDGITTLAESCIGPGVTTIYIPNAVTDIADSAFERASSLTSIIVMDGNENYYTYGGMLYSKDGTLLACPQSAALKDMVIPEGVHTIAASAFSYAQWYGNLERLTIPASLTTIEKGALGGIMNTAVYGPVDSPVMNDILNAGLTYNEYMILYYSNGEFVGLMTNRAGELLPATAKPTRAGYAFAGWSLAEGGQPVDMAEYTMPAEDLVLYAVWSRVSDHVFWMEVPKMMSVISEEMLQGSAAEAIRCHDGIETIEKRAFADCAKLKIVEIHNAKAEIAADAFDGCDLSKITIYAPEGSTAQTFAQSKGIVWKSLN